MFIIALSPWALLLEEYYHFCKKYGTYKMYKIKKKTRKKQTWFLYRVSLTYPYIFRQCVYKNACRPYRLYPLSRAICDERDRENSRFDLACGAHECLRSTPRGMQMCHGLRQATWPRNSTKRSGASRRCPPARHASYSVGHPSAIVARIYG